MRYIYFLLSYTGSGFLASRCLQGNSHGHVSFAVHDMIDSFGIHGKLDGEYLVDVCPMFDGSAFPSVDRAFRLIVLNRLMKCALRESPKWMESLHTIASESTLESKDLPYITHVVAAAISHPRLAAPDQLKMWYQDIGLLAQDDIQNDDLSLDYQLRLWEIIAEYFEKYPPSDVQVWVDRYNVFDATNRSQDCRLLWIHMKLAPVLGLDPGLKTRLVDTCSSLLDEGREARSERERLIALRSLGAAADVGFVCLEFESEQVMAATASGRGLKEGERLYVRGIEIRKASKFGWRPDFVMTEGDPIVVYDNQGSVIADTLVRLADGGFALFINGEPSGRTIRISNHETLDSTIHFEEHPPVSALLRLLESNTEMFVNIPYVTSPYGYRTLEALDLIPGVYSVQVVLDDEVFDSPGTEVIITTCGMDACGFE